MYGIVPAGLALSSAPAGVDDAALALVPDGATSHDATANGTDAPVAALVSVLDGHAYAPEAIERDSGDVDWLSPRALAHDHVLTWASDLGPVVPLPMFSLFSARDAVEVMLRDRATGLEAALRRIGHAREYALRVYRLDEELRAALPALSPRLAELAATAAAASPGQRYLLERKLENESKAEFRAVSQRIADDIADSLSPLASATSRLPIARVADGDAARGIMIGNAAYLVAFGGLEEFQRTLTSLVERYGQQGFRFDFTGPWPAYHFADEAAP